MQLHTVQRVCVLGGGFTHRVTETFSKEIAKEGDHDIKGVTYVANEKNVIARRTHLYLDMCPYMCLEVNAFPLNSCFFSYHN